MGRLETPNKNTFLELYRLKVWLVFIQYYFLESYDPEVFPQCGATPKCTYDFIKNEYNHFSPAFMNMTMQNNLKKHAPVHCVRYTGDSKKV